MAKKINGFLKININGFHTYLNKVGSIVDIFYKKNKNFSFSTQNNKMLILQPHDGIENLIIDNLSISMKYNKEANIDDCTKYFRETIKDLFKITDYKCSEIPRIGHAIRYIIEEDETLNEIKNKMFVAKNKIINFNSLVIEISTEEKKKIDKTLDILLDTKTNMNVLSVSIDYSRAFIKYNDIANFMSESTDYLNNDDNILEGLY